MNNGISMIVRLTPRRPITEDIFMLGRFDAVNIAGIYDFRIKGPSMDYPGMVCYDFKAGLECIANLRETAGVYPSFFSSSMADFQEGSPLVLVLSDVEVLQFTDFSLSMVEGLLTLFKFHYLKKNTFSFSVRGWPGVFQCLEGMV